MKAEGIRRDTPVRPGPVRVKRPPRTVKVVFAGQKNHGTGVGRLIYEDRITLTRGEEVEVTAADAAGIRKAFGARYEIQEVG